MQLNTSVHHESFIKRAMATLRRTSWTFLRRHHLLLPRMNVRAASGNTASMEELSATTASFVRRIEELKICERREEQLARLSRELQSAKLLEAESSELFERHSLLEQQVRSACAFECVQN